MIAKGTTHNNGAKLADYMTVSKEGERAELWQLRGFEATNIKDAFRDVQIMAGATKCEQPFFHLQIRNREGETLTRQQWEYAADRIERMLGLTGQPRAITFHTYEHNDNEHSHGLCKEPSLHRVCPHRSESHFCHAQSGLLCSHHSSFREPCAICFKRNESQAIRYVFVNDRISPEPTCI